MTALAADLTAEAGIMTLDGVLDVGSYQAPYTIDSENVLVTGGDNSTTPSIIRGANGTAPATHSAGATVTSGWGGGGVANPLTADLQTGADERLFYAATGSGSAGADIYFIPGSTSGGGEMGVEGGSGAAGKPGGDVVIAGGSGDGGNDAGASITIGGGSGAGAAGLITLVGLPTSDPSVAGALWNSTGTVKISAGP